MPAYFRVSLVLLRLFLFFTNIVFTGTISLQSETSSGVGLSSLNGEWQRTQSLSYDTVTQSFVSTLLGAESGTEPTAVNQEDFLGSKNAGELQLKKTKRSFRSLFLNKALTSLYLFFCVTLMVASSKKLSAQKVDHRHEKGITDLQEEGGGQGEEEETLRIQPPDTQGAAAEDSLANIMARLEKIRNLLPAAQRLASAVDLESSWRLLETIRMAVEDADEVAEGAKDCSAINISLSNAFTALDKLHKAALRRADELVQVAKALPPFPVLGQWGDEVFALVRQFEEQSDLRVMDALLMTYYSLGRGAAKLAQQLREGERLILSCRPFQDEEDKDLLLGTAKVLEFLRVTGKSRCHIIAAAKSLRKNISLGFKEILLENCNDFIQRTENRLKAVALYAASWKPKDTRGIQAGALSLDAGTAGIQSDHLKEETAEVQILLERLLLLRQEMLESTTVADVYKAYLEARDIGKQAISSIENCWLMATSLPSRSGAIDALAIQVVTKEGEEVLRSLLVESAILSKNVGKLREAAAKLSQSIDEDATSLFSKALLEDQLNTISKIAIKVDGRVSLSQSLLDALKRATCINSALKQIFMLNAYRNSLEKDKTAAALLKLSFDFLEFLRENTGYAAPEVFRVTTQAFVGETPKYKKLDELFNAAKMHFQKAAALRETARAATDTATRPM